MEVEFQYGFEGGHSDTVLLFASRHELVKVSYNCPGGHTITWHFLVVEL